MSTISPVFTKRRLVIIGILGIIAAIHLFRVGRYLPPELYNLYYSYFSDFAAPFGTYFLLCAVELQVPFFRNWKIKAAGTFLLPAIAETGQYLGIPILGTTFDPLDYIIYGIGTIAAVLVETQILARFLAFWNIPEN